MAPYGRHAKDPRQVQVGKHGVTTRSGLKVPFIILAIVIVAAICLVPPSIAKNRISLDSKAFGDSTRATFSGLVDVSPQDVDGEELPASKADYTSRISAKMQNTLMSGGCEIVALGIVLDSMGIDADLDTIVHDHLNIDGHFATGYSGSPYSQGAGYPPGIVEAANSYLESLGEPVRAHNLTGSSFSIIKGFVNEGYPVLVWTTMNLADPQFAHAFDNGVEWYGNEHCVVLYGFEGDTALVSDPLEGLVERDASRFADLYAQCGSMAIAVF